MKTKHEINLTFRYKGKRNYVQGPDIYNKVLNVVIDCFGTYPTSLSGSFHRLLRNNGICTIGKDIDLIEKDSAYAFFSMVINTERFYALIHDAGTEIVSSYEYDERHVLGGARIDGEAILMRAEKRYSYMEEIVAMTKKLHLSLYPNADGKWLWTKFEIEDTIDPKLYWGHDLTVECEKNFYNRLTQCSIRLDARRLGAIYFSLFSGDGDS